MAFPFVFESNFEQGTNAEWSSESDTGSLLDYPHVSALAGMGHIGSKGLPFRGAYCARWVLGDTNDHTVTSSTITIADTVTRFFRFYILFGNDFAASAADVFNFLELQQAGGTIESSLGFRVANSAASDIEIGHGDGTAPTNYSTGLLSRNRWYAVEWKVKISSTGSGTLDLYVDGALVSSLTTLTNAAGVDQGVFGSQNTLSTTTGTILADQFVEDDARIYPITTQYPREMLLTKSSHIFVGPGKISNVSLLSGAGTDNVCSLYDTNRALTSDANKIGAELKNTANSELVDPAGMPVRMQRGCYVALSGTNPRAMVSIDYAPGYGSNGAVRTVASRLRINPQEL